MHCNARVEPADLSLAPGPALRLEHPMPSVVIDVRREYSEQEETALLTAARNALIDAFRVPANTINAILCVHRPSRFLCPPGKSAPERFTNVSIFALTGRTLDTKNALYSALAENFERLGIPRDCLLIKLHEMSAENIATRGAKALCEIDLGYSVRI